LIDLLFEPDPVSGADWLELSCFLNYPSPITKAAVVGYLEGRFEEAEILASDIFRHIEWRGTISPNYPFYISNSSIFSRADMSHSMEYLFPLLLSTHNFYRETKIADWSHVGDLFELFCTASINQLFGNAVLIGNTFGGFPTDFDNTLEQVCKIVNERKGPPHPKAKDFQDAGVDIIAWKAFDKRKGQIVLLVQCASGSNWRKKGGDIKPRLWNQLVFWTIEPVKVLTFPYAFDFDSPEAQEEWSFYAYDSGLLLDRLRLTNFKMEKSALNLNPVVEWSKNQIDLIATHQLTC
jgi:hypothetical protein